MRDHVQGRGQIIDDNATYTGKFNWVWTFTDCAISAMTTALMGSMSGKVIPAGSWVRVDASSITLTSGSMIAYSE